MVRKWEELEAEKQNFQQHQKEVMANSEKLSHERDKVLVEKAKYDAERDKLMKMKGDLDFEKSLLQSDYLKAEELEHELKQRENLLNMFKFSKDQKHKDLSSLPFNQLGFGGQSLPTGQKVHEIVAAQNNIPLANKENMINSNNTFMASNASSPNRNGSRLMAGGIAGSSAGFFLNQNKPFSQSATQQVSGEKRFDYDSYMQNLQNKLEDIRQCHEARAPRWAPDDHMMLQYSGMALQ